jgi:predicted Zn-dependent protease
VTRHRAALALALALTGAGAGCETVSQVAETVHLSGTAGQVVEATRLATGALADIDEPQEIEIGRAVTAAVGGRYRLLRDPALTRYVAMVGNAVAAHSERPDLRYYFGVLDTPEVNAFAAPGGYVFVTRGALRLMRDEAVLASVLGHEISHVALRHGVDAIRAQKQKELAMFAVREGVAQNRASGFASAVGATAEFFTEQVILKGYSREQETAADRAGVQYAGRAGYDRAGLRDFLDLDAASGREEPPDSLVPSGTDLLSHLTELIIGGPAKCIQHSGTASSLQNGFKYC